MIRTGRVDNLNVAPQQTAKIKLDLGKTCQCTEWLLNVSYKLKNREGLLSAGHVVAKDQLDAQSLPSSFHGIEELRTEQYRDDGSPSTG